MDPRDAAVWKSPADYNRAARRAARLFSNIWKWDLKTPVQAPRYARRHWTEQVMLAPKTRRERRHRERIMSAMRRIGQASR
jgi:hypothetical protein